MRGKRCEDLFNVRRIIPPDVFKISNYRRKPIAVFNPGVAIVGSKIHVFPRLIFDYYKYTSAIGHFEMDVEEFLNSEDFENLKVDIILWPRGKAEFLGCEDPRVYHRNGEFWIMYTAKGFSGRGEGRRVDKLGLAVFDESFNLRMKEYIPVKLGNTSFFPKTNKDSAILRFEGDRAIVLTRPEIGEELQGWRGILNLKEMVLEDLEPVLPPAWWELKTGWSTNVVSVEDGYLIGWHAVVDEDLSYRNGFALMDDSGYPLKTTDYVLCPKGLEEELGDRALVIFGDGLFVHDGKLVWVGGVSDYAIGIFITELERVLGELRDI